MMMDGLGNMNTSQFHPLLGTINKHPFLFILLIVFIVIDIIAVINVIKTMFSLTSFMVSVFSGTWNLIL